MRSILNVLLFGIFGLALSFCSSAPKEDESAQDVPKYDNYHSSGVYNDIEKEGRSVSSEDYSDDDYGDTGSSEEISEEDNLVLSDVEQDNENDPETESDPLPIAQEETLPVEKMKEVKKPVQKKKIASVSKFKDGMYKVSSSCTMRSKPSTSGKSVGKVNKGKKLWMENHNKDWVKVFKKSGPVYINKLCL